MTIESQIKFEKLALSLLKNSIKFLADKDLHDYATIILKKEMNIIENRIEELKKELKKEVNK